MGRELVGQELSVAGGQSGVKVSKLGRQREAARGLDDAGGTHARRDKSFWRACDG